VLKSLYLLFKMKPSPKWDMLAVSSITKIPVLMNWTTKT